MKRVLIAMAVAALGAALLPTAASAATCTPTGFFRDGFELSAAQIGGNVTGTLDATGCNIGVYYGPGTSANVAGADIFGANYFGVVARGASVNVTSSSIHDIGQVPLDGSQHGLAVYFATVDTGSATAQPTCTSGTTAGTVSGNLVFNYQKGGIIAACTGTTVRVANNTVTGQGPVPYIAQNGIQVGYGAKATVAMNHVSGNAYTGAGGVSSGGILVVGGDCFGLPYTVGLSITKNTLEGNDVGVWLFNADSLCNAPTFRTNNSVKQNTISSNAVTNTTGWSQIPPCGYQAGVADVGHRDLIVNNSISGLGYTQVTGDCDGIPPAFVRRIDLDSSARGVASNK